jgi:hypothetical protein
VTQRGFNKLWDAWLAVRQQYPGKLPVVRVRAYEEVNGKHGSNFAPVFEITGWVDRPADLPDGARPTTSPQSPPAHVTAPTGEPEIVDPDAPEDFEDLEPTFS